MIFGNFHLGQEWLILIEEEEGWDGEAKFPLVITTICSNLPIYPEEPSSFG